MGSFVRDADGRFAGSVGSGKNDVPSAADTPRPVAPEPPHAPAAPSLDAVYDGYQQLGRQQTHALDMVEASVMDSDHPIVASIGVVRDVYRVIVDDAASAEEEIALVRRFVDVVERKARSEPDTRQSSTAAMADAARRLLNRDTDQQRVSDAAVNALLTEVYDRLEGEPATAVSRAFARDAFIRAAQVRPNQRVRNISPDLLRRVALDAIAREPLDPDPDMPDWESTYRTVVLHPNCPTDVFTAGCYAENSDIRRLASSAPGCPEEDRVAAALLGHKG